jgi:hypothetical protein
MKPLGAEIRSKLIPPDFIKGVSPERVKPLGAGAPCEDKNVIIICFLTSYFDILF